MNDELIAQATSLLQAANAEWLARLRRSAPLEDRAPLSRFAYEIAEAIYALANNKLPTDDEVARLVNANMNV